MQASSLGTHQIRSEWALEIPPEAWDVSSTASEGSIKDLQFIALTNSERPIAVRRSAKQVLVARHRFDEGIPLHIPNPFSEPAAKRGGT